MLGSIWKHYGKVRNWHCSRIRKRWSCWWVPDRNRWLFKVSTIRFLHNCLGNVSLKLVLLCNWLLSCGSRCVRLHLHVRSYAFRRHLYPRVYLRRWPKDSHLGGRPWLKRHTLQLAAKAGPHLRRKLENRDAWHFSFHWLGCYASLAAIFCGSIRQKALLRDRLAHLALPVHGSIDH